MKKSAFKIFFNWTSNAGIAYYRMINPGNYMRRLKGVEVAWSDFKPSAGQNVAWENEMTNETAKKLVMNQLDSLHTTADISVWQMCHTPLSLSVFLAFRDKRVHGDKKILLDLDDDAFNVNPESYAVQSYKPGSINEAIIKKQIINASGLIVSTEYLKKIYEPFNPYIEVIPNGIDFELWDKLKKPPKSSKIRIGWAGGQSHDEDLKVIGKIIPVILNRYRNVEFMFYGHESKYIQYYNRVLHHKDRGRVVWKPIDQYPQELASLGFDIGIAPLRDNSFNRAKSNLRWLEYSALKIPTVASRVEPFKCTHSDGLIKVMEPAEWISALGYLIENEGVRRTMGKVAYNDVKSKYNAAKIADRYVQVLMQFDSGKIESNPKLVTPEAINVCQ